MQYKGTKAQRYLGQRIQNREQFEVHVRIVGASMMQAGRDTTQRLSRKYCCVLFLLNIGTVFTCPVPPMMASVEQDTNRTSETRARLKRQVTLKSIN